MGSCHWCLFVACCLLLLDVSFQATSSQQSAEKGIKRGIFFKKKSNPGFFGVFTQFVRETIKDTNMAVRNFTDLIYSEFPPPNAQTKETNATGSSTPTVTFNQVSALLGRNYRSLVQLFNTEFSKAVGDSKNNAYRYGREFREAIRPYFTSGAFTSTTTRRTTDT